MVDASAEVDPADLEPEEQLLRKIREVRASREKCELGHGEKGPSWTAIEKLHSLEAKLLGELREERARNKPVDEPTEEPTTAELLAELELVVDCLPERELRQVLERIQRRLR